MERGREIDVSHDTNIRNELVYDLFAMMENIMSGNATVSNHALGCKIQSPANEPTIFLLYNNDRNQNSIISRSDGNNQFEAEEPPSHVNEAHGQAAESSTTPVDVESEPRCSTVNDNVGECSGMANNDNKNQRPTVANKEGESAYCISEEKNCEKLEDEGTEDSNNLCSEEKPHLDNLGTGEFSKKIPAKSRIVLQGKTRIERLSAGDKIFKCRFCKKAFSSAINKKRHERLHRDHS